MTWALIAANNHTTAASLLYPRGFNIPQFKTTPHDPDQSPLNYAVSNRNPEMVKILLEAGSLVDQCTPLACGMHNRTSSCHPPRTPLQLAAEEGYLDMIDIVLKARANVNAPVGEVEGATALQIAAIKGFIGIAKLLLDLGADPNAPRAHEFGRTALEGAAEYGRIDMIELLLRSGVEILSAGTGDSICARLSLLRDGGI
ncbi:ankyrin repeat-containing domain protein [Podospora appendiculata]|uniref:Ankyrin repeat-containing domain protein n=1 Tax=Podospora appendiculata TaxID=314037 RepID=A0AAE1CCT5_9PEZI|nr:ankyrin repeat-containing domain protein [Podospora appendiculata]